MCGDSAARRHRPDGLQARWVTGGTGASLKVGTWVSPDSAGAPFSWASATPSWEGDLFATQFALLPCGGPRGATQHSAQGEERGKGTKAVRKTARKLSLLRGGSCQTGSVGVREALHISCSG